MYCPSLYTHLSSLWDSWGQKIYFTFHVSRTHQQLIKTENSALFSDMNKWMLRILTENQQSSLLWIQVAYITCTFCLIISNGLHWFNSLKYIYSCLNENGCSERQKNISDTTQLGTVLSTENRTKCIQHLNDNT